MQQRSQREHKFLLALELSKSSDDAIGVDYNQQPEQRTGTKEDKPYASNTEEIIDLEKNKKYILGLIDNLSNALDMYILKGSNQFKEQAQNIMNVIKSQAQDQELVLRANRMARRAGLPAIEAAQPNSSASSSSAIQKPVSTELGRTDSEQRRIEAKQRKEWEEMRTAKDASQKSNPSERNGKSALTRRQPNQNGKPEFLMMGLEAGRLDHITSMADDIATTRKLLHDPDSTAGKSENHDNNTNKGNGNSNNSGSPPSESHQGSSVSDDAISRVSELVARAGAESAFAGENLGIGGLDNVLSEVKRRVWTPLAAPPQLLRELGIRPVRGLLLYGRPGCGKTLLARKLGGILSPLRPVTVVSGPEILDKFVGSSEANLRQIFDNPPDIYDFFRLGEPDGGHALASTALHVIVMDEFDAIARTRGGRTGAGDQGDAGVARDSVVNQLLAKMDGVEPLCVPTMVIGLTNKRSLIDPALLRAGRFEVQVEVPPPRTEEQRVSILKVHTAVMHQAGRILCSDAPINSPGARKQHYTQDASKHLVSYSQLLHKIAGQCEGFSGASLAGLTRAAASHALERAVNSFSSLVETQPIDDDDDKSHSPPSSSSSFDDCVVTWSDFEQAIKDVKLGMGDSDWSEEKEEDEEPK